MTVEKPKPKQLLRPIATGANSAMNQSQFLAITCNSFKEREKSRVHGAIGFGFASHWLKNWRESLKPITKRSNRNHVITFDSHLKTALMRTPDTWSFWANFLSISTWLKHYLRVLQFPPSCKSTLCIQYPLRQLRVVSIVEPLWEEFPRSDWLSANVSA